MSTFNIICGLASIASLVVGICTLRAAYSIKVHIGLTKSTRTVVRQKAEGKDIMQAGGDING
jgi:hypothetical protein